MTRPLRVGFKVAPQHVTWARLDEMWRHAGASGAFESAWLFDHFYPVDGDGSCFEGMSALAALIRHVPGLQVGHLVLANPYRHPALTAKMAATLDHISGGRFVLGMGAGWHVPETSAYGMDLDPIGQRLRDLRAAIQVIREMARPEAGAWPTDGSDSTATGGVSLEAPPYRLVHARNDPLPVQGARMPIWLGVQGERVGLRMVAELADGWNFNGATDLATFAPKLDVLRRHCDDVGRDVGDIEISMQLWIKLARLRELRDEALAMARAGVRHMVLYIDGREGTPAVDGAVREIVPALRDAG
jgi:alkanesulfonate monooxygenase SsuD/methylene tetrahydromethanopterin reductase-like flavin-dependent oxidoreductase (luciferase family)